MYLPLENEREKKTKNRIQKQTKNIPPAATIQTTYSHLLPRAYLLFNMYIVQDSQDIELLSDNQGLTGEINISTDLRVHVVLRSCL